MTVPTLGTTKTSERVVVFGYYTDDSDISHTVDADTTLLVVDVVTSGADTVHDDAVFLVTWDIPTANEEFIRVSLPTRTSKTSNDPHIQTWALVNPTIKTANINIALTLSDGVYGNVVVHATNYKGTSIDSVAAAIRYVDEAVNLSDSTTCVIGSGGTSGALLHAVAAYKGSDTDPLDLSSGWTSTSTMYLPDPGTANFSSHLAYKDAPSAITWTGTGSDPDENNMGVMLEIGPPGLFPDAANLPILGRIRTSKRVSVVSGYISDEDVAHTVEADTTLLVVDVITSGADTDADDGNFSVTWDQPTANEALTRVNLPTRTSKTANDPHIQTWAILNPTAKAANIRLLLSTGTYANVVVHATNYKNTITSSLGAAIQFVDDDVNLADSATCDIGSGGSAGNLLHAVMASKGTDTDPLSPSVDWQVISTKYDEDQGSSNWASNAAYKPAAAAITWTLMGADSSENNMGVMLQIVPQVLGEINNETLQDLTSCAVEDGSPIQ